ncbi:MAG: hypothetical protein HYT94_00875, partial [Parcubacteria group bacterium]|nr:hypothetical protein [Parcubacteria group bacterium]
PEITRLFDGITAIAQKPAAFWNSLSTNTSFMIFQVFLLFLSAVFFACIVILIEKITLVNSKLNTRNNTAGLKFAPVKSTRFAVVEKHMTSENPGEWRLAIIEADTLLEEIVKKMGYEGTTLGEMLKNVEPSDFTTLNEAWEAHKVRNQIAHQGSSFTLTKREAKRIIQLYEKVFREFDII